MEEFKTSLTLIVQSCVAEFAMSNARLETFNLAVEEKIDTSSELVNRIAATTLFTELDDELRTDSITEQEIESDAKEAYIEYYNVVSPTAG